MERSNFFDDQYVYSNDLNNTETTKADQIILRTQAPLGSSGGIYQGLSYGSASVIAGGVFGSPADYSLSKNLMAVGGVLLSRIDVYPGTALSPTGELIIVPSYVEIPISSSTLTTNWTSTPSVLNYVKIRYQESSGSFGTDDLGNSYATRYYGSYFINIDGTPPDTTKEILLATFTANGSGVVIGATWQDSRLYVRTITPADAVILSPTKKIVGSFVSVEDHVNAKGSGIPTVTNPHGLTPNDLGVTDFTQAHRLEAHASAIIDSTGAYPNTLFDSYLPSISAPGPNVYISFQAPELNAGILVGGVVYFTAAAPATIDLTDTSIFTSGDTFYWIYIDSTGNLLATTTNLLNYSVPDKFVLCSVQRMVGGTQYDFFVDLRVFFPTTEFNIRSENSEPSNSFPTLGNNTTLYHNLTRIRYQLSKAINGTPGSWTTANPPLTAGPTSYADAYHTHQGTTQVFFTINSDANNNDVDGNLTLRFNRGVITGSVYTYAGLQWYPSLSQFNLYKDVTNGILSPLQVSQLNIGTNWITQTNASNLLTVLEGGASSNADSLHTHPAITSSLQAATASLTTSIQNVAASTPTFSNVNGTLSIDPSTIFHNTGSVPEFVTFAANSNAATVSLQMSLYIGPSSPPSYLVGDLRIPSDPSNPVNGTLNTIVPGGYYFQVTTTNTYPANFVCNLYILSN
jgi:hypothetical protein